MKKGQAAIEFLFTYGWAILVVLAAIGTLAYFDVISPCRFNSESEFCLQKKGIVASSPNEVKQSEEEKFCSEYEIKTIDIVRVQYSDVFSPTEAVYLGERYFPAKEICDGWPITEDPENEIKCHIPFLFQTKNGIYLQSVPTQIDYLYEMNITECKNGK